MWEPNVILETLMPVFPSSVIGIDPPLGRGVNGASSLYNGIFFCVTAPHPAIPMLITPAEHFLIKLRRFM